MNQMKKEEIIRTIRNSIIKKEYKPGERLTEASLSRKFGVSRTPIREVLSQIEKEGFVKITPSAGAKVVELSDKEILDIYDLLIALEGTACKLACFKITDEQIEKLKEYNFLCERATADDNTDLLVELNSRFHWLITETTDNSYLINTRSNFRQLVDYVSFIFPHIHGQGRATVQGHIKIIDALTARNPPLAEFIMREHLEEAKKNLSDFLLQRKTIQKTVSGKKVKVKGSL